MGHVPQVFLGRSADDALLLQVRNPVSCLAPRPVGRRLVADEALKKTGGFSIHRHDQVRGAMSCTMSCAMSCTSCTSWSEA